MVLIFVCILSAVKKLSHAKCGIVFYLLKAQLVNQIYHQCIFSK